MNKSNRVGEVLKRLRLSEGLSQRDMAYTMEISTSLYGAYERGDIDIHPDTLVFLADWFDVSADYLLGRSDDGDSYREKQQGCTCDLPDKRSTKYFQCVRRLRRLSQEDLEQVEWYITALSKIPRPDSNERAGEENDKDAGAAK